MTKKEVIRRIKDLIVDAATDAQTCKGNDSKMERYYNGKLDAYETALEIVK